MKRLLILSITILTLISCSSNDDNLDPFVGTWSLFSRNGQEVDNCSKKITSTVFENGNVTSIHYEMHNNECILDDTFKGTWANKGDGNYGITREGHSDESVKKVTFSDNNNTWSINEDDGNGGNEITTYKRK